MPYWGWEPRLFALASDLLAVYVANQGSGTIILFPLNGEGRRRLAS